MNINPYAYTLEALLQSQQVDQHDLALFQRQGTGLHAHEIERVQQRLARRAHEIERVRALYHRADGLELDALDGVMTPAEIEMTFGVKEDTVRDAIQRGWIEARQSGSAWLVRRADAEARWGRTQK